MSNTHFSGPVHVENGLYSNELRVNDVYGKDETGAWKQLNRHPTIAKLSMTASGTYDSSQLQSVADKVDAVIQLLMDAGIIRAS